MIRIEGLSLGETTVRCARPDEPQERTLDDAFGLSFPFEPGTALLLSFGIGILGTAAFLAIFWRPPQRTETPTG